MFVVVGIILILQNAQAQFYEDRRCRCVCPGGLFIVNSQVSRLPAVYTSNVVASKCNCEGVVLPVIGAVIQGKEYLFCPRCSCTLQTRNTTLIMERNNFFMAIYAMCRRILAQLLPRAVPRENERAIVPAEPAEPGAIVPVEPADPGVSAAPMGFGNLLFQRGLRVTVFSFMMILGWLTTFMTFYQCLHTWTRQRMIPADIQHDVEEDEEVDREVSHHMESDVVHISPLPRMLEVRVVISPWPMPRYFTRSTRRMCIIVPSSPVLPTSPSLPPTSPSTLPTPPPSPTPPSSPTPTPPPPPQPRRGGNFHMTLRQIPRVNYKRFY